MKRYYILFLIAILNSIIIYGEEHKMITITDLHNKKYAIIGNLDKPLGEIVTIEARVLTKEEIKSKAYLGYLVVEIEKINGENLKESITLEMQYDCEGVHKVTPDERRIKYVGFESGCFIGLPNGYCKYIAPVETLPFHFMTFFVAIKKLKVD